MTDQAVKILLLNRLGRAKWRQSAQPASFPARKNRSGACGAGTTAKKTLKT